MSLEDGEFYGGLDAFDGVRPGLDADDVDLGGTANRGLEIGRAHV